ncbi:Putative lipase LipH [Mycobacterium canettii CIPT 140070017]|nr:Putative lipase LipH [Mycobacterium canettii CIPT 140070017]
MLKMLLDTFPVTFTAADGVEVARARLRQLATPGVAAGATDRGTDRWLRRAHRHSGPRLLAAGRSRQPARGCLLPQWRLVPR